MQDIQPQCARCKEPMEPGYLLDRSHFNLFRVTEWVKGAPTRGFLKGLKLGARKEVEAYRCPRCGLLEQYARF